MIYFLWGYCDLKKKLPMNRLFSGIHRSDGKWYLKEIATNLKTGSDIILEQKKARWKDT
jgi:hypothetical protein